ncbi:hypothetical protein BJ912DRAFT_976361 [Pholiota molesta]|nr:hypothetical protein BJ912DRAFT_976361 [Pholiota molesta]
MSSADKSRNENYGFNKDHFNMFRFGLLLNINEEDFQNITLRKKYLNILYSPNNQKANLQLIESELTKKHPQTFRGQHGPKHLYFAMHIVMAQHAWDRYSFRHGRRRKKDNAQSSSKSHRLVRILWQSSTYPVVSRKIQHAKMSTLRRRRRHFLDYVLVPTLKKTLKPNVPTHRTLVRPNETASRPNIVDSPVKRSVNVASRDTSLPLDSVSAITPPTWRVILEPGHHHRLHRFTRLELPPQYTQPTAVRHVAIYRFLKTCQPPMMHYLRRFVDFGCVTSTHLQSVSLWRSEQRYNLLKKILESDPRNAVMVPSEMDIAI